MPTGLQKSFATTPMRGKSIFAVPGLNQGIGNGLVSNGITLAETLYGHFLALQRNRKRFTAFLLTKAGFAVTPYYLQFANAAYDAFQMWYFNHQWLTCNLQMYVYNYIEIDINFWIHIVPNLIKDLSTKLGSSRKVTWILPSIEKLSLWNYTAPGYIF